MKTPSTYTVITGASSGIGYATALAFAKRGSNLILVARRQAQLDRLKADILQTNPNLEVIIKKCDLSVAFNYHKLYTELRDYKLATWINNAGFGYYSSIAEQDLEKVNALLAVNIQALTLLSILFVRDYKNIAGTQLINVSSRGGYTLVPNAITYCASKFYVGAFTEGLAHELKAANAKMQAKVLAPAATQTEFGKVANGVEDYDYQQRFKNYHTSEQMADFLLALYDSRYPVGIVDSQRFVFELKDTIFPYAANAALNQNKA